MQATRNFSIVGLVATQRRAPVGLEIGSSRQFGCTIVEAGWARAPLSNKSSGVLLALRKPFTTQHIHQTWTPPPSLQGRAIAARLKGGFFDLFVCLHVSSAETTNRIEEREISKDCGSTSGMVG